MRRLLSHFLGHGSIANLMADKEAVLKQISGFIDIKQASIQQQKNAIDVISANSQKMAREQPKELVKLKNDIELVTPKELISKFEEMLQSSLPEAHWQRLFEENPFILNMAFGISVIKIRGFASVGGRKISGDGDKIADFLFKNSISNNAAIVEIKTPATKLLNASPYRDEIYSPSSEITGAVNQTIDQIHKLQTHFATLKMNSRICRYPCFRTVLK